MKYPFADHVLPYHITAAQIQDRVLAAYGAGKLAAQNPTVEYRSSGGDPADGCVYAGPGGSGCAFGMALPPDVRLAAYLVGGSIHKLVGEGIITLDDDDEAYTYAARVQDRHDAWAAAPQTREDQERGEREFLQALMSYDREAPGR